MTEVLVTGAARAKVPRGQPLREEVRYMLSNVTQDDRKWLVKAKQHVTAAKAPCSVADVVGALGRPPGRSDDDIAEILDALVGLRRLKKLPLRWEVGRSVQLAAPTKAAALKAHDGADHLAADGRRVRTAVAADLAGSEPPGIPPQRAPRPVWPSAPFGGEKLLRDGEQTLTWPRLVRALTDTVASRYVDDITLRTARSSPAASVSIPVRICRAVDARPYFLACVVLTGSDDANSLGALDWHLWAPHNALRYDDPRRLMAQPVREIVSAGCVATWRASTPLELARALAIALHALSATSSCGLHVTVQRAHAARRDAELQDLERQRRAATRSSQKPVRGFCRACGQPLRDAVSLRRGYGPECFERLRGKGNAAINLTADVPVQYWAGARPLPIVRRRIVKWLRGLPCTAPGASRRPDAPR